jgi:hypothetical protein
MFGYIVPLKPELKIKDYQVYKGYYCGLCKQLHREYSLFSRFFLNYECAFIYLLFSSLSPETPEAREEACIANPFVKKHVIHAPEASYAAALNLLFGYNKLKDNAVDDRDIFCYILKGLFTGLYRKSGRYFEKGGEIVSKRLDQLTALEKRNEPSLDKTAHEFACLIGEILKYAPYDWLEDEKREFLHEFGYNLGRFIYILDAYDDLEKDIKKKSYNPLLLRFGYTGGKDGLPAFKATVREDMEFNLFYSLSQAAKAYESLKIERNRDLLDNIVYLGLHGKTSDVLEGRKRNGSV